MPSVGRRRESEPCPRCRGVAGNETREVDAGGDRRHPVHRDAVVACELAAQRFAGGDDVRRSVRVEPPRRRAVANRASTRAACARSAAVDASSRRRERESQLSVELCVLRTSMSARLRSSQLRSARQLDGRLRRMAAERRGGPCAVRRPRSVPPAARRASCDDRGPACRAPRSGCGFPGRPSRTNSRCGHGTIGPAGGFMTFGRCAAAEGAIRAWLMQREIRFVAREPALEDQQHPKAHRVVLAARRVLGERAARSPPAG